MAAMRNAIRSATFESRTKKMPRLAVKLEPSSVPKVQCKEVPKPVKLKDGLLVFKDHEDLNERYLIMGKMGQGTFGQVLQCWDRKRNRHVAIKVSRGLERFRKAARLEIQVLMSLSKKDIERSRFVQIKGWFEHEDHVCIVLEKLSLSLLEVLKRNYFCPFPVDQVQEFGAQILESVACMHELGLIHTDLKPDNVVLVSSETKRYSTTPRDQRFLPKYSAIKLIDFGCTVSGHRTHFSIVSARNYRAPEVILGLGWTYPCDIWSIGCLLVELCTGALVFEPNEDLEHLAMMERVLGPLPKHIVEKAKLVSEEYFNRCKNLNLRAVSAERRAVITSLCSLKELVSKHVDISRSSCFVDLLHGLFKYDPNERLTARNALAHPFFKDPI